MLSHVHVVLARPSEPRNIGATCRAIKNFGISRLTIVTQGEVDYEAARPLAIGADDLLHAARVVASLPEATEGASLVAGITRRLGQKRKTVSLMPWEFAGRVAGRSGAEGRASGSDEIAVVFGNERSGLSDEELLTCHIAVSIPTSPACPSLNLSHAVEVICYELYKAAVLGDDKPAEYAPAVTATDAAARSQAIVESLERLDFHTQEGPQGMRMFLRDLIARAGLSEHEAVRFEQLFAKIAGMHGRSQWRFERSGDGD